MRTVYVVEDDEPTRRSLCERIDAYAGLRVAGSAGTCACLRAALTVAAPDVLLLDLGLPDGDGLQLIAEVMARHPRTLVMVITVFGDERRVIGAIEAGASGYLLKDDSTNELGGAIQQLLDGGSPISPAIARHLIRRLHPPHAASDESDSSLSPRELEVLSLAAKGFSYSEIARMLGVTANTVGSYTKRIYGKLTVHSRSEAVYEASRLGLIAPPKRSE